MRIERPTRGVGLRGGEKRVAGAVGACDQVHCATDRRTAELRWREAAVDFDALHTAQWEIGQVGDAEVGIVDRHPIQKSADLARRLTP